MLGLARFVYPPGRRLAVGHLVKSVLWMEIKLERRDTQVLATVRASNPEAMSGTQPGPVILAGVTIDRLERFRTSLADLAARGAVVDEAVRDEAWALHEALFAGAVQSVYIYMRGLLCGVGSKVLLLRLVLQDRRLQAIPWEALCPRGGDGFLGTSDAIVVARDGSEAGAETWRPPPGPVRPLLIVPVGDPETLLAALGDREETGEVEPLDPIVGDTATPLRLGEALRQSQQRRPNLVHFVGHGGPGDHGSPALWLADGHGGQQGIPAASLAGDLRTNFDDLRFVVLDACRGADPGRLYSAGETLLGTSGARAVVAYLWPVDAEAARICSRELYRWLLTDTGSTRGDVGASLNGARRVLARSGSADSVGYAAESFSPVLYLRGTSSVLFDLPAVTAGPGVSRARPTGAGPELRSFTRALRDDLLAAAATVPWPRDVLLYAFRESAPADRRFGFDDAADGDLAGKMILELDDAFCASADVPALLAFVATLGALATAPAAAWARAAQVTRLKDWVDRAAGELGLSAATRDALRARAHVAAQGFGKQEIYLVIALEATVDEDRYRPYAYRMVARKGQTGASSADTEVLDIPEDRAYRLDELEGLIEQLIAKLARTSPIVELVAPIELLIGCKADQWLIQQGVLRRKIPLGASYRVALRSWERCYDHEELWDRWNARWRRFLAPTDPTRACACIDDASHLPSGDDLACAKLRLPPDIDGAAALLDAGIPVAVWPRRPRAVALDACLSRLSPGAQEPDWRELIRRHREMSRAEDEAHSGRCLVLLWDDYDRRPPNPGERSPGTERRTHGS